jgi:hypothetical protein
MILSQISYLDCVAFLVFLAPQLLIHVGIIRTASWLLGALPSLRKFPILVCFKIFMFTVLQVFVIPYQFIQERHMTPYERRSPFVQRATVFQDIVIRCVRYAFAFMPAWLGRVFFSKGVSLPFLRFRMLRHGIVTSSLRWHEIDRVSDHSVGQNSC